MTGQKMVAAAQTDTGRFPGQHTVVRNTILLSAGMAALYAMNQLTMAIATITFAAVTGLEGLAGLGPAIFFGNAAFAAFTAGRAMDRWAGSLCSREVSVAGSWVAYLPDLGLCCSRLWR